jgi:hypothetical protein
MAALNGVIRKDRVGGEVAISLARPRVRTNVAGLSWYNFTDGNSEEQEPQ